MRSQFLFLFAAVTVITGIGILAFSLPNVQYEHTISPPPPEAFLGRFRGELNDVAAGNTQPTIVTSTIKAASSTRASAATIKWTCAGVNATNFDCYEAYYTKLTTNVGIIAAFDDLKARYLKDGYIVSQCHPLTHVIGRAASEKFATPGEAYKFGDSFCWSGYYHGVLEGIIGKIGLKNLPAQIDGICASIKTKDGFSFDYYNCVHGLGHGAMEITQDELFDALALCDHLTGTWEQLSCGSGVFMENIIVDGKNHITKYLKPSDPLYPCDASPDKYKNTCYLMQTSYMLKVNGRDFVQTFKSCSQVEAAYRPTCYQSLGRDASGQSVSNVSSTDAICLMGTDDEGRSNCVIGAVKDFISYFHSDVQAKQFCNSFSDQNLARTCLDTGTAYYSVF